MGQLDDAVNSYIRAIELDTEAVEPASNLANLLTSMRPVRGLTSDRHC